MHESGDIREEAPAPLRGCLICHAEGNLSLIPRPSWRVWEKHPTLVCSACGARAFWDDRGSGDWQIRYRWIPHHAPFAYAHLRFGGAGWLGEDEALELSTQIYIQRQYLLRLEAGQVDWLKPERLNPPPPLMAQDELVYLTLKPVSYVEVLPGRWNSNAVILDSGTCYITTSKIHLLGQQRDRSHRHSEITHLAYTGEEWSAELSLADRVYAYRGYASAQYDAELVVAILRALRGH